MSREEAESRIAEKVREIKEIMREYGAPSGYLSIAIFPNIFNFYNEDWGTNYDEDPGLDYEAGKILNYQEVEA